MRISGMRTGVSITLGEAERRRLEAVIADRNSPQKHVWRAQIVLMSADGIGTAAIMTATDTAKTTVWRWQARFMDEGVDGLLRDKTRPPGKPPVADDKTSTVVAMTLKPPPHEATHWTARAMAKVAGLAVSTVQKIWKTHGLAPHRWRQFKLSNDPAFTEAVVRHVGLVDGRAIGRVGPYRPRRVGRVEQAVAQHRTLVGGRVRDLPRPDEAMADVDGHVVLVAEGGNGDVDRRLRPVRPLLRLGELHRPARVAILVPELRRPALPILGDGAMGEFG